MTDPTTDISNQSPWAIGLRWLLGQPFNNVLTFLLLCAIGYGMYLGVPMVAYEVRQQRSEFTEAIKQQRVEFLSGIKQHRDDCAKERELERGFAQQQLQQILRTIQPNLIGQPNLKAAPTGAAQSSQQPITKGIIP